MNLRSIRVRVRAGWDRLVVALRSRLSRLTLSYLLVMMIMSLGFSVVIYHTSLYELRRQIPPPEFVNSEFSPYVNTRRTQLFFERRYEEGRLEIIGNLIVTNLAVLAAGGATSYYLARRTLRPIERALEAQSRFASDASHELRTPLTAIQTENEVALRKPKLTVAEAKQVIASNVEEVIKLRQLSEGLLRLAREEPGEIELSAVLAQDIVADAMNHVVKTAVARRITIQDNVSNKIRMLGDSQSLVQAVVILLDNAIKYSASKKTIYLEASRRGKHATLQVRDEGPGIGVKDLPRIFDRFYRVDASRSHNKTAGYGLGLALAKQIVEQQGGEITVQSTVGKGSTFGIRLPAA